MKQYNDTVQLILNEGEWKENRTGIRTLSYPVVHMRFKLSEGFPAVTTKKLAFKAAMGELAGFLKAAESASTFRELNCKIWDQNANENADWLANPYRQGHDHLGSIYGVQWRNWPAYKVIEKDRPNRDKIAIKIANEGWDLIADDSFGSYDNNDRLSSNQEVYYKNVDQIEECVRKILFNPNDRRILFHGWNWAALDEMALPPCHLLYQFLPNVTTKKMSLALTIRSNDIFLGAPFNIASASLLLSIVCHLTGYTPDVVAITANDAHIYENHIEQCHEQLSRTPYALPTLKISDNVPSFEKLSSVHSGEALLGAVMGILSYLDPDDFTLEGYEHHPPIKAAMAV